MSLSIVRAEAVLPAAFERPHRFDGIGAHLWPGSHNVPARDQLLRDLHAPFVRVGLGGCVRAGQLVAARDQADFHTLDAQCSSNPMNGGIAAFRDELASLGIRPHLVFWDMPPPWRVNHGSYRYADAAHLADMAQFLAAETADIRRRGINPIAVELTNEPNGVWNTQYKPQDYATLVSLTRKAFDEAGMRDVLIEGPGTSNDTDGRFLQAIAPLAATHALGLLTVHEYDTQRGDEPAGLRLTNPDLQRFNIHLPIYITEFGSVSPKWHLPPYDPKATRDSPNFAGNSREFGVSSAGEALKLLADGASGIFFWDLEDVDWAPATIGSGLLTLTGQRRPAADALVVAFQAVRPGAQVAALSGLPDKVVVLRFLDGKGLTIVAANLGTSTVKVRVPMTNIPPVKGTTGTGYYDSAGGSVDHHSVLAMENGAIVGSLPPRSIVSADFH